MRLCCELKKEWECSKPILEVLDGFLSIHYPGYETNMCRLYHLMALGDHENHCTIATDKTTLLDGSMVAFWLLRGSDSKEADSIARRGIYRRAMGHINDSQDLVHALRSF